MYTLKMKYFFYISLTWTSFAWVETFAQSAEGGRYLASSSCDIGFCSEGTNCNDPRCSSCDFTCGGECDVNIEYTCNPRCKIENCGQQYCAGCLVCNESELKCPLGTFQDVTSSMFSQDPSYWYLPIHSGMPYLHQNTPTFVDLDNDGILDYFNSMHGHRIVDPSGSLNDRMELALTRASPNEDGRQVLESIAERIVFEDDPEDFSSDEVFFIDAHGQNILDLDGDGILDLYISQGGRYGLPTDNPAMFDNFLLFGEKNENGDIIFRGGRTQALMSGVNMRNGRGRISYMLDVNGDGLIDIFVQQSRRVDNQMAPGVLLINQGNRTWTQDQSMMEYANTMLLTDADGDGKANEIMIIRGACFPERSGPGVDPKYPEFGEYTEETLSFCRTRPVGTTAIYKFNKTTQAMEEISPRYENIMADNDLQPPCCPHGSFDDNCAAISMVSGDLDNDKIADQVILYTNHLVLYFSSDRPKGTLPIGQQFQGLTINLPDYCGKGESVRIVDLDNTGEVNILVMCQNPGAFVILDRQSRKDWKFRNDCNQSGSLGDLNDRSLAIPDLAELLPEDCKEIEYKHYRKICREFKNSGKERNKGATALTMVDMNNDGFTDAIVSHSFGYLRFHYNVPSDVNKNNKFIAFKLQGDGAQMNRYGIGATLKLTCFDSDGKQSKQFREISSIQHTSDKKGYQDDRIIFGLGANMTPVRLDVIWPNGKKQRIFLDRWVFSTSVKPILVEYPLANDAFSIYLSPDTETGSVTLCLSAGYGKNWKSIKVVPCSSPTPSHEIFRFDRKKRLRSKRFRKYCLAPSRDDAIDNTMHPLTLVRCKQTKDSWLRTIDGYWTLSGSKKGITIGSFEYEQVPYLSDVDTSSQLQQWKTGVIGL